ncbi:hypothetical protein B9T62_19455 [Paenibacillus donghaensis]|uniref:F5/8 type C domain-containing protein n=2 Tax=Paenibacillus donghaensis TaxID=414771 RepID=A0A2Z2K862_9BACL|nr:hypothetical protein B9T62_19455 [Paenibacillus donghaensis]
MVGITNIQSGGRIYDSVSHRGYFPDGKKWSGSAGSIYGSTFTLGDTISILLDMDNGILEFWKNGVTQGVAFTDIKPLGTVYPSHTSGSDTTSSSVTANFGATLFKYAIPNGFKVYNGNHKILLSSGEKIQSVSIGSGLYSENVIPIMSSNTSLAGISSANLISTVELDAWKAFDGSSSTYWYTNSGTGGWLQFKFNIPIKIEKYKVLSLGASYPGNNIKNWTFEGSNNGSNWNVLDTKTNVLDWITGMFKEFAITNDSTYIYYRLNITATGAAAPPAICELTMHTKTDSKFTFLNLDSSTENTFLRYGLDGSSNGLNLTKNIFTKKYVKSGTSLLGSGKTFEHTIDMSKRRVDKITLG